MRDDVETTFMALSTNSYWNLGLCMLLSKLITVWSMKLSLCVNMHATIGVTHQ